MKNYKKGETVYVKAVVDREADENHKLLRLVTETGTVIWASPDEVASEPEGKGQNAD